MADLSAHVLKIGGSKEEFSSYKQIIELDNQIKEKLHQTTIALRKGFLKANKVTSRDDHIFELSDSMPNRIHVLEEVPTFCMVKLKGNLPPLKLKISYENSEGDLEIYASMHTREPTEKNY